MKNITESKIIAIRSVLKYLTPTVDFQPQLYNRFVEILEENISNLYSIINSLEKANSPDQKKLLRSASRLLRKYQTLQKEYYS